MNYHILVSFKNYFHLSNFCVNFNPERFSVQPPAAAINVTLPAVAVATPAVQQSIDISCPPGPQQQTRRTLLQRANGTDRGRTDAVPLYRPCSAYCTGSANKLDPTWGKRNTGSRRHERLKFEERLFSCSRLTACNSLRSALHELADTIELSVVN